MSHKNLPFVYIDSAGVYHIEQDGKELAFLERITTEQDAELGPSFVRYTITGTARIGSPDSRVYHTKDENGQVVATKPDYSAKPSAFDRSNQG